MKRRDFLKSCGASVVGIPALAVGAKSETFEARPGFVPAVVLPEPETENYGCHDYIVSDEEYEQIIDEVRRIREFEEDCETTRRAIVKMFTPDGI